MATAASTPNSIELKYTLYGDTALVGMVGLADFAKLTQTYGNNSGGTWDTGDWNYDGSVNFADFNLLTRTYGSALGNQAALPAETTPTVLTVALPTNSTDVKKSARATPKLGTRRDRLAERRTSGKVFDR